MQLVLDGLVLGGRRYVWGLMLWLVSWWVIAVLLVEAIVCEALGALGIE